MSAQYPRCYITRSVLTDGSLVHDVTICMDSVSTTTIFCCNTQPLIDALMLNNVKYVGTYQTVDGIFQEV